jgi:protein ImuB
VLLDRPEPVEVMALTRDGAPAWIRWRHVARVIVAGIGPERIAGEWWGDHAGGDRDTRDYFKVQDETGRWMWVYREFESDRWFVHGAWA